MTLIRILLVEDDEAHAELIRYSLGEARGFEVLFARAVRLGEATLRLEEDAHDVVLLDLSLPDSSFAETVSAIPELSAKCGIPIIALTSLDDPETYRSVVRHGARTCISKMDLSTGALAEAVLAALEASVVAVKNVSGGAEGSRSESTS